MLFRSEETGEFENWCFEDLPVGEQQKILDKKSPEFIKSLALALSGILWRIGDQLNLSVPIDEEAIIK